MALTWGFHLKDLIRLTAKLCALTYDAERKATLRAALETFIAWRDDDDRAEQERLRLQQERDSDGAA